jgi:hypothetical protein
VSTTAVSVTQPRTYTKAEKYVDGRPNKGYHPEMVAQWETYLDEGYSYRAIAEIFGVDREKVRKRLPGRGWTHKQAVELGTFMKHHNEKMRKATYV